MLRKGVGMTAKKKEALIDPIYQKYVKSVMRALGSTEFYEFFMDSVSRAENEFQFSNRRVDKTVDLTWIDAIEDSLEAFQKIISSPRHIIKEDELIVNVAHARKTGPDVVRHLTQHAAYVEDFDTETGDVRPNRVMQKYREDTIGLYENRLVFTTMENAYQFVKIRHDALLGAMGDEFGAKLKVKSNMETATELVHLDMFLHIRNTESAMETDGKNHEVFERISRLYRILTMYMNSPFAEQMAKLPRIKGAITKTNVLKKNPNYKAITKLWDFLHGYDEIGYAIRVIEQNPTIDETFERDIYHNILFNYLILKGYLQDEQDRKVTGAVKGKKRTLKPKFIREIIEELTEDYDLPDVEIRKVLIEELTKEQLMKEESAERRRLVEEQAQRKKEEKERLKREQEAERERIRQEKAAERERIRQEKAAEEERLFQERMAREIEDRRRSNLFRKELNRFYEALEMQLEAREAAAAKKAEELADFADAAQILEESNQRRKAHEEREQKRIQERNDRIQREKQMVLLKEQQEKMEAEERERQAQAEKDTAGTKIFVEETQRFFDEIFERKALRMEYEDKLRRDREAWEEARRQRRAQKTGA